MTQKDIVASYRQRSVTGGCIDLVPIQPKFLQPIVELRNQESTRYNLNQTYEITLEMQRAWYERYLQTTDDLYWCIVDKRTGDFVGTVRLYEITPDACRQGSFIIDERRCMGMPYALEAEILSLEFAFCVLGVQQVINDDRCDNVKMNAMSRKLGFRLTKTVEQRGVPYNYYALQREDLHLDSYKAMLQKFLIRLNRPSAPRP